MGFFRSLFDFSFSSFVTNKIIKFLYILTLVLGALGALYMLVTSLANVGNRNLGGATNLLALIIVPLGYLIWIIFVRVGYELMIILFQIAENTRDMAWALTRGQKAPTAAPVAPPTAQPPQYPQYPQAPQYPQYPPQQPQPPQYPPQGPQTPPTYPGK